ncbi:hypothetical protein, partial [Neoroseomonas soli]
VGPAARDAAAAAGLPFARVITAPAEDGGWPVAPALSGEVLGDGDALCMLGFRLRAESVPAIRGIGLYVNAASLPLTVSAEPGGTWLATATLPAALLRRAGPVAAWDLVQDGAAAGEAPVLLAVAAAGMAGTLTLDEPPAPEPIPPAEEGGAEASGDAFMPETAAAPVDEPPYQGPPRIRWDLSAGIGPEEGPFPDLDLPGGVRWIVARDARLVVEAAEVATARLALAYRSLLPRQGARVAFNGGPEEALEISAGSLKETGEYAIDLDLRPGANELRLGFSGAVREPGSGRELVLLIESATLA